VRLVGDGLLARHVAQVAHDDGAGGLGHPRDVAPDPLALDLGQLADAAAFPEGVGHVEAMVGGLVVEALEVGVERVAARAAGQVVGLDALDGHLAAGREEQEVGEDGQDALPECAADRRGLALGPTEAAAPDPARADEDDAGVGGLAQKALGAGVAAEVLEPGTLGVAGGVEKQVLAALEGCCGLGEDALDLLAGRRALLRGGGHGPDAELPRHPADDRAADLVFVGHGPRAESTENGHQDDGVDERRVVGHEDDAAGAPLGDGVEALDADAVAQPERAAGDRADEPVEHRHASWAAGVLPRFVTLESRHRRPDAGASGRAPGGYFLFPFRFGLRGGGAFGAGQPSRWMRAPTSRSVLASPSWIEPSARGPVLSSRLAFW